jgi:hypothetical protein
MGGKEMKESELEKAWQQEKQQETHQKETQDELHCPLHGLVIHRFLGDHDIMGMTLLEASRSDANKVGLTPQLIEIGRAHIAHPRAKPAQQLIHHIGEASLVGNSAFDAFRHKFAGGILTVAIA